MTKIGNADIVASCPKEPRTISACSIHGRKYLRSERGVVLLVVIVVSAVALALMTALIYMITTGTQISGLQKRYKTALEASLGGGDVIFQLIATRAEDAGVKSFESSFDSHGLNFSITTPQTCSGISSGATYSALQAKFMTPSSSWQGCDNSVNINTADPSSYDMKVELGTGPKYNVYAKIVASTDGNSGADQSLLNKGVVTANTGEVTVTPIPYLYTIEVVAENSNNIDERARLSILYQY